MKSAVRRFAAPLLLLAAAAGLLVSRSSRFGAHSVDQLVGMAQQAGPAGWMAFAGAQVVVAALGVLPASLLAIGAGLAYGLWLGFLVSAVATLLGGWIAFALSRTVLRPFISHLLARYDAVRGFDQAVAREGWKFVCLVRISPLMPFAATSYGLGMTGLGHRAFLAGTLASLPALAAYVSIGAFARTGLAWSNDQVGVIHAVLLGVGAIATILIAMRVRRMIRDSLPGDAIEAA